MAKGYAGKHYSGAILESEDTFTYDAAANTITTTVENQVFTLKADSNGDQQFTRSFIFKAKSGRLNFYLNEESDHNFKVEQNEIRGLNGDVHMNIKSFEVHAATGAIFEFDCIA